MFVPSNQSCSLTLQGASITATIPKGWTGNISTRAKGQVEDMLKDSTGLSSVTFDLTETGGNQYLFVSGSTFYFWNVATEAGVKVLNFQNPKDKPALYTQMESDIRKVQAQRLPYVAP